MIDLSPLRQLRGVYIAWAVLVAMLLSSLLHLPRQLEPVLPRALELARLWDDPAAQIEAAVDAPHRLLWAAEAHLPLDAKVLLITAAWDPELDQALLERTRYALAPRTISPMTTTGQAGLDTTNEDQLAFDLTVFDQARQLGASHLLSIDPAPRPSSANAVSLDGGSLVALDGSVTGPTNTVAMVTVPTFAGPQSPKPLWPLYLAAALTIALLIGDSTLRLLRVSGGRLQRWTMAWPVGSALLAWAMLVLGLCRMPLALQVPTLALGSAVLAVFAHRVPTNTVSTAAGPVDRRAPRGRQQAIVAGLVMLTLAHFILVALLAVGRPWLTAESWSRWGLAGRTIFRFDGLAASAALGDPLGLPLAQAWVSTWLGQADERLLGCLPLLSWVALLGLLGATVREYGGSRALAWMTVATAASLGHLWTLAGRVVADPLLAALATVAALAALHWQRRGRAGDLALCVLAIGLLATLADAGVALVGALLLALWMTTKPALRSARTLALLGLGLALGSGPGWWLRAGEFGNHGVDGAASGTIREVLSAAGRELVAPGSAAVWILLLQVVIWRTWRGHQEQRFDLLLIAAVTYLGLVIGSWMWQAPAPGQATQLLWRHGAHVLPLALLWLAMHGTDRPRNATSSYNSTSKG